MANDTLLLLLVALVFLALFIAGSQNIDLSEKRAKYAQALLTLMALVTTAYWFFLERKGLPHADGLVVGYLPKEKILVYADMFNLPNPLGSVPDPPVVGSGVFADNIDRLKLDVERIMSVHSLNPDRMTTVAELKASLGRK